MKTIEELEARLETVTRERDLSLSAWESAGMQGRTAQSAMLELARQLEEARAEVERLRERVTEHQRTFEAGWSVLREQRDEARRVLSEILALWPYLNCACGRNKPRLSEALREAAKKATT